MIDTNANEDNAAPSAPIQGAKSGGSAYWRSLDHVADTAEFREYMHREFPKGASELMSDDRRTFLKVMGASFALAGIGLGGCRRWPVEEIAPYANRPEGRIPGEAEHYATAWEFAGRGVPMVAASMAGASASNPKPNAGSLNVSGPNAVVAGDDWGFEGAQPIQGVSTKPAPAAPVTLRNVRLSMRQR